ncbi:hypothetical protein BU24DRAFT_494237 [Aaosphaeria arxii CBS 175.79]|uniref:Mitochondrial export translocase Oxa2 n=1 Tax=Aaosphaeria arxii CBS 175.79 TaxID=1450172 RepID=A0A6A5XNB2_9PLEO|nr:uncharacterized protein BU24DRAFT_494237 [Aaosphaeria arxii CBS 175.79]KAF2013844.1 hypothetical protein BU24DRAFT_494237 [Aaosphaeria arxii CBS 175.79]
MLTSRILPPLRHHTPQLAQLRQTTTRFPANTTTATTTSPLFRPLARRSFHATAPQNSALDAWLYLPHELLQTLHVALPWYAAIPVSAFLVRGLLVTTLGSRSRSLTSRYVALHPLRQAIGVKVRDQMLRKGGMRGPREAKVAVMKAIRRETGALDRRWRCTLLGSFGWTLLQLPLWFTMTEVVRRMGGFRDGLLRMGMNALGLAGENSAGGDAATAAAAAELAGSSYPRDIVANPWFDATLGHEGMLWFPSLLDADPLGALSYVVSALMFANVYVTKNTAGSVGTEPTRFQRMLRRTLLGVSLAIGPLCTDLPAGLLLYWASSTMSVIAWNQYLDWKFPVVRNFGACKRPLLLMPPPKIRSGGRSPAT